MQQPPYLIAQEALVLLKKATYELLAQHPEGLTNAAIGKHLGIYKGYSGEGKQLGHISRTILGYMSEECVVEQTEKNGRKVWSICN